MAKVNLRAYNRDIETMIDRGQLDEAIAHCQHILKTFPKHLETYRLLGKAYLEYKRYKDAVDIFMRVLASEPNDFVSNVGMSIIRDEENKLDDAIWHMERAFEVQPSNPAIQGELQRLYGRRDGVQPPRIRMTRGALAHMYVQGELYPQAISEIKSVLKDDQGRNDMQVLLARAYYRSGQKNDAADTAMSVLHRYPYCLDANRVLVEILAVDRPDKVPAYRQRVYELDPYATQVTGTVFQSADVNENAVTLERLDWNGQPVRQVNDWGSTHAIAPDAGLGRTAPSSADWGTPAATASFTPPPAQPEPAPAFPASNASFDFNAPSVPASTVPTNEDNIPDFMRAAGWGTSTGAFDESQATFADEPAVADEPIAQADLPDWVKAMMPQNAAAQLEPVATQPVQPAEEEDLPDWIKNIGTGTVAAAAAGAAVVDQPDWLKPEDESQPVASTTPDWMAGLDAAPATPASDQPDWMADLEPVASSEQPDWLKGLDTPENPSAPTTDQPDWMQGLAPAASAADGQTDWMADLEPAAPSDEPGWLKGLDAAPAADQPDWLMDTKQPASESISDQPDWLKGLDATPASEANTSMDWMKNLDEPTSGVIGAAAPAGVTDLPDWLSGEDGPDASDQPAWLKGIETTPEPVVPASAIEQPDWLTQFGEPPVVSDEPVAAVSTGFDFLDDETSSEASVPVVETPAPAPVADLGTSQTEIDDSLAWLEGLAAKQGATEGLLVKPEDRKQEEPDWVKKIKGEQSAPVVETPTPVVETPAPAPVADLGTSQTEIDDSLAWLEGLAAKQGATEGLLVKPEDRKEEEPDWVKQAKSAVVDSAPAAEEPAVSTDTAAWLRGLEAEEEQSAPVHSADETALWLKSLDAEPEPEPVANSGSDDDLPGWLQGLSETDEAPVHEAVVPTTEADDSAWLNDLEELAPSASSVPADENAPVWLKGLDEERAPVADAPDLPAWLRDDTGEVVAEPTRIEPTRPSDWHPADAPKPEPEPVREEPKPQPVVSEPVEETPKPKPAPRKPKPVAEPRPEPYREPVTTIRGTGMLNMPVDPVLGSARSELSRSNIPGALDAYGKLIKKGKFLDEVIFDLREALYRYPVEVSIWQSLGDAYMRANRLQDALDAYTKAEELLR